MPGLLLEQRLAGVTDAMVAVSDVVRGHVAEAIRVAPGKIALIPNGL